MTWPLQPNQSWGCFNLLFNWLLRCSEGTAASWWLFRKKDVSCSHCQGAVSRVTRVTKELAVYLQVQWLEMIKYKIILTARPCVGVTLTSTQLVHQWGWTIPVMVTASYVTCDSPKCHKCWDKQISRVLHRFAPFFFYYGHKNIYISK